MMFDFQQGLQSLYKENDLTQQQAVQMFTQVFQGGCQESEITALLIALKMKGEVVDELAGAALAMRNSAQSLANLSGLTLNDCCGTGGDGFNTINASTLTSIIAAGLGLSIAKHGNRSVSSSYGSADLMQDLGIDLSLSPEQNEQLLKKCGWAFLFAPHYHQGMKHVMPVRNQLKTRTVFNLIGPLANPANPSIQLLGVYDPDLCKPFASILKALDVKRAMVVHGSGLDEITIHGETHVCELKEGAIESYLINPQQLGLQQHDIKTIQSSDASTSLKAAKAVLDGSAPESHIDMVAINVGALLYLNNKTATLNEAVQLAKDSIKNGVGQAQLNKILQATKEVSAK